VLVEMMTTMYHAVMLPIGLNSHCVVQTTIVLCQKHDLTLNRIANSARMTSNSRVRDFGDAFYESRVNESSR